MGNATKRFTKRWMAAGALAGVLAAVAAETAQAQDAVAPLLIVPGMSQPTGQTAPPKLQAQPQSPASVAPVLQIPRQPALAAQPVVQTKPKGVSGIDIGGLKAVDPEAVGTLNGLNNGLTMTPWTRDQGANLWFATDRNMAIATIQGLPNAPVSPAAQAMVRQILLTAAAPQAAGSQDPQAKGQVVAARIEKLVQMGRATDAVALANVLAREVLTEPVILARTQAQWLQGDVETACATADRSAQRFENPVWPKMQAACAAIAGDTDKAQLKLALLNELNTIDAAFQPIADKILGRKKLSLAQIPATMGPFEAVALQKLGGQFPKTLPLTSKPWLAKLAIPVTGSITDDHLALVEFALAQGLMTPVEANEVYQRVKFTDAETKAVLDLKAKADTPRGRALYWMTLQRAAGVDADVAPAAKIEIIARMLKAARHDQKAQIVLANLLSEHMASLSQEPLAAWLAGDGVRLALWSGNWSEAANWVILAEKNTGASAAARQALHTVRPLMALASAAVTPEMRAATAPHAMLESWSTAQGKRGLNAAQILALRDRMFALYRIMSLPIHAKDWRAAMTQPTAPTQVLAISPLATVQLSDAAAMGARGQVLSAVARTLDVLTATDPAPSSVPSSAQDLGNCVQALLQSAAVDWAKRIAVETLLFNDA